VEFTYVKECDVVAVHSGFLPCNTL